MRTCENCIFWRELGSCATSRRIVYDNRHVEIPPGKEGQCRAAPPVDDNRWPLSMAGDWCGCYQPKNLTEATTPRASAAGETPAPAEPDSAQAPADAGEGAPPVKPAAASAAGGPPSLLQRLTGRGQGRRGGQQ
jgi:hypothetical protein